MPRHLVIEPEIGEAIVQIIHDRYGANIDLIMIAIPVDGDWKNQPTFVSTLMPGIMEQCLADLVATMPVLGLPLVRTASASPHDENDDYPTMVRKAISALAAFAHHAPDISNTLKLDVGIVCGAASNYLDGKQLRTNT